MSFHCVNGAEGSTWWWTCPDTTSTPVAQGLRGAGSAQ
jgi:hypothetical protein